ncbi:PREDICTED: uncharacterized protein LOC106725128 [Myotis brandtii]|uniref:uncharacterized protein LOC106725128 n=1 Tax=Myotis brandtii TaxID=109478 RepID=UPI000703FB00|nr:PREDICTED: uncharacterized protein LOC106725128 [Myotis brandtii]
MLGEELWKSAAGSAAQKRKPFDLLLNGGDFLLSRVKAEAQAFRERVRGPRAVISSASVFPRNGRCRAVRTVEFARTLQPRRTRQAAVKGMRRSPGPCGSVGEYHAAIEEQQRGRVSRPCERERPDTRVHAEWIHAFEVPGQAAPFLGRKWSPSEGRHLWRCQWPRRGLGQASRCAPQGVSVLARGTGGRSVVHCLTAASQKPCGGE